jgi:hypothetical protein
MTKISTDSPYYDWAKEIMDIARVPQSCVTMRIAELLEANLPGWLDALDHCDGCTNPCEDCDQKMPSEPRWVP